MYIIYIYIYIYVCVCVCVCVIDCTLYIMFCTQVFDLPVIKIITLVVYTLFMK
jgi:hypothetical protein